ncbi:MAG: cobalt ECF transporter T component CbiQ, partial [Geobacteraceae bacterium]|nr:cobalt ECF transporter T component CbiQ [Geobacteraceae bacterium]
AAATALADGHAGSTGLLQRLDPRCKLAGILALLVAASLLRSPAIVWGLFFLPLLLACRSGIAPGFFIGRVFPPVLLFGAAVALPAVFNIITPGEPLWVVAELGRSREIGPWRIPAEIAVTRQGLHGAVVFTGRVAASVSLALLLPLTTRWNELLRAFAAFRVPQLFILVLAMTCRYLALLVRSVAELHEARKSRTVRYLPGGAERRWVASRIGYLFGKSYRLSQEVHDAMLARGFAGEVTALEPRRAGKGDFVWLLMVLLFCIALIILDRANNH